MTPMPDGQPLDDASEMRMQIRRINRSIARWNRSLDRLRRNAERAARAFEVVRREDQEGEEWKPPGWKMEP